VPFRAHPEQNEVETQQLDRFQPETRAQLLLIILTRSENRNVPIPRVALSNADVQCACQTNTHKLLRSGGGEGTVL
jgi:hypothetical protein